MQEKSLIMKKMSKNIHNFDNIKSVVPVGDEVIFFVIFRGRRNEKNQ